MDLEKELKKVRDEAAQRRVELAPYKKAFDDLDEEATEWMLETLSMIKTDPHEAGQRFASLAYGNMGEDAFKSWAGNLFGDDVDNYNEIGENRNMDTDMEEWATKLEERLMSKIEETNAESKQMFQERERNEQFKEITQTITALGYEPDSWQGKMLVSVATNEVDNTKPIGQRLADADTLVRERIGDNVREGAEATSEQPPQNLVPQQPTEPLDVPATGGQIGGGGVPNIAQDDPITFNDADNALRDLLKSQIGQ